MTTVEKPVLGVAKSKCDAGSLQNPSEAILWLAKFQTVHLVLRRKDSEQSEDGGEANQDTADWDRHALYLSTGRHSDNEEKSDRFVQMRQFIRDNTDKKELALEIARNRLKSLSTQLHLSTVETDALILAMALRTATETNESIELSDAMNPNRGSEYPVRVLAHLLNAPLADCRSLTLGASRLHQLGLLKKPENRWRFDLGERLRVPDRLMAAFSEEGDLVAALMDSSVCKALPSTLDLEDFHYCADDIRLMRAALSNPSSAGNVLIFGEPGLGKTELARLIGRQINRSVHEVRVVDGDDDPASRSERFSYYALTCQLLNNPDDTLIIFDEAEDVFVEDHWAHRRSYSERHKGWTNRLLEMRSVATIWISNSADAIDPAYLRRFDYIFEMKTPPRSVRRTMLARAAAKHPVSSHVMDRLSEFEELTPADCDRVSRLLGPSISQGLDADRAIGKIIACRPGGVRLGDVQSRKNSIPLPFELGWIHTDGNLKAIVDGLRARGAGALTFCGPPGTGKTEFVRQMARLLDCPLHLKKASDLLSKYVGGTEERISAAFEAAERDGAILFLDEADSFLRSRDLAERSWEVTQVNELLAQIDQFNGIVVLATNHGRSLDPALMRRMDVKLNFGYLKPDAAIRIFEAAMQKLEGVTKPIPSAVRQELSGMRELALGDFSAAMRRIHLEEGEISSARLLTALHGELQHKSGWQTQPAIGFLRH